MNIIHITGTVSHIHIVHIPSYNEFQVVCPALLLHKGFPPCQPDDPFKSWIHVGLDSYVLEKGKCVPRRKEIHMPMDELGSLARLFKIARKPFDLLSLTVKLPTCCTIKHICTSIQPFSPNSFLLITQLSLISLKHKHTRKGFSTGIAACPTSTTTQRCSTCGQHHFSCKYISMV